MKKDNNIISGADFMALWKAIRKNWYLLILFPVFAGGIAYFYVHRLTEVYGAKSQILIKSEDIYDYQQQIYKSLGAYDQYSDIQDQIRILSSYDLIESTLSKLKFNVSYYIEGRVKTTEVFNSMPFVVKFSPLVPHLYGKLFDLKIIDANTYSVSYIDENENKVRREYLFDEKNIEGYYILNVDKAYDFRNKNLDQLKAINYQFSVFSDAYLVRKYKSVLKLENIEFSSILELSVEDEIAERAKMFLDTLSKVYISYNLKSQIDMNDNTVIYINKQLDKVTTVLDAIETDFENFKSDRAILDLSKEETEYFVKMSKFDAEKSRLLLEKQSIESLEHYILNLDDEQLLPPSLYILEGDVFLSTSLGELYSLQMKRNSELFGATEESIKITQSDQKVELLRKNILVYLNNTKKALLDKTTDVEGQIKHYEELIRQVPKSQRELLAIERKRQINEKLYMLLLEKRENAVIAKAGIISQTKVIEKARSVGMIRPNRKKIYYMFVVFGLLLAVAIAFIRYFFFEKIENILELKALTDIPILGGVPYYDKIATAPILSEEESKTNIIESLRGIRTNLQYMTALDEHKAVLITSLHPGEGKTFVSSNIASIIARTDRKVLLIDLDMHKPKIHKMLQVENSKGASTYLVNKEAKLDDYVLKNVGFENLEVLLAGPIPPNPSELVMTDRLKDLIYEAKSKYDLVIIDTSPIGLITDALVLMKYIDASLFVMNTTLANKKGLEYIEELIATNKISNFGLVLNNIQAVKWQYYYGYKYNYGYGYGYGHEEED